MLMLPVHWSLGPFSPDIAQTTPHPTHPSTNPSGPKHAVPADLFFIKLVSHPQCCGILGYSHKPMHLIAPSLGLQNMLVALLPLLPNPQQNDNTPHPTSECTPCLPLRSRASSQGSLSAFYSSLPFKAPCILLACQSRMNHSDSEVPTLCTCLSLKKQYRTLDLNK